MPETTDFLTGVIEGFYGRSWSFSTRFAYIDYLTEFGLNSYIYCPKSDPYLRRQWQEHWPDTWWRKLVELGVAYRKAGLEWGAGLSPVELYRSYGVSQRDELKEKVARLCELEITVLAILFDDMPGDMEGLAARQAEIVSDVCRWAPNLRVLVCPTYYSFDPVLEQFFGQMPPNYWSQLGRDLPAEVDIFWTGNTVCSAAIEVSDIASINECFGRPVTLWDNYPVNDGAVRSNCLYTSKLSARPGALRPLLRGHLCNPMNQGLLSLPALSGLAELYGNKGLDDDSMRQLLGPQTWERLLRDRCAFEQEGRSGLGDDRCAELAAEYDALPGMAAMEIAQWLRGEYSFDPACLTD